MKTSIRIFKIVFPVFCVALLPNAQAVVPPPDGGYPGGNTAEGQNALLSLTTGGFNTAVGFLSLRSDATNSFNTAIGAGALLANTSDQNTAVGAGALLSNTIGIADTANGAFALFSNTTGEENTAVGDLALFSNTEGIFNTANGWITLQHNTSGSYNTAVGVNALGDNTTGSHNIAIGYSAGQSNTTGNNNIYIGVAADSESDTMRIGGNQTATYITGISGATVIAGTPVVVDSTSKLGTVTSSKRFKENIKPMGQTSEGLFSLNPVSFRYKKEIDPGGTPQLGLVAEDVEKVNRNLIVRDKEGKPYSVRYDQVNAMLLNEFLKEHKRVEALNSKLAEQERVIARQRQEFQTTVAREDKQIGALIATAKEQAAQIEKVTTQIEMSKASPQLTLADSP